MEGGWPTLEILLSELALLPVPRVESRQVKFRFDNGRMPATRVRYRAL